MKKSGWILLLVLTQILSAVSSAAGFSNSLRARGYSLIPAPQKVELGEENVVIDRTWAIESQTGENRFAADWLIDWAGKLQGLSFDSQGPGKIVLRIIPGTVKGTDDPSLNEQGYRLVVSNGRIEITGNAGAGLFYGVQSVIQLMRRNSRGQITLPACTITDWPDLQLRFIHWDTKHHQERPETLKRIMDWLTLFKVNCIGFEMEDKYEYPRHPIIGAPGAYTKQEMQEFTRYALERQIQLVPVIQAPAHMAYVLKHPEFARLRADSSSNYQACMCDEEAIQLIFDMYQDMIDATPGVKYFHVSTDEVYFAGICARCKKPYNPENRSQAWVDYVLRAYRWLAERGRRMLCWVEYPVLSRDIIQLPPDLINGVMGSDPEFLVNQRKIGMRQLAYTPIQGSELLFPNYFPTEYRGRWNEGRLEDAERTVREGLASGANPIGSFSAAWDDSGLHEETFWLGWVTVTQYAWTYRYPTVEQNVADFMDVFYGPSSPDMVEVYEMLEEGARFFESGWDRIDSRERERAYDDRGRKFETNHHRTDLVLSPPSLPQAGSLAFEPAFGKKYRDSIERAAVQRRQNDRLINLLSRNLSHVERNRYNLEVLLSIAYMERYFIRTLLELESAEQFLVRASAAAADNRPEIAVGHLVEAGNRVASLLEWENWMWGELTRVWEKSRYPKGRSVEGRQFLHIMDDLKDHSADRRPGLEYMLAPFERIGLKNWHAQLISLTKNFAAEHNVPVQGLAGEIMQE
ncbi:MAG TPA: beta-N-acetylhexosaminidase [archaeon]|nr:beta-N-acetylhexosaminidase [archaeon]